MLSIDADEHLTPELVQENRATIAHRWPTAIGCRDCPSYCGRHAPPGWWPDKVLRPCRRSKGRFTDARVHERLVVDGKVADLAGLVLHESFRSLDQVLDKVNHYSRESAQSLHERGRKAGLGTAIGHGLWAFIRTYLLREAFWMAREGFILSVSNAEGAYYRYLETDVPERGGGHR